MGIVRQVYRIPARPRGRQPGRTASGWARTRLVASARDAGSAPGVDPADLLRSLARQSILVALATAIVDTVIFALSGVFTIAPGQAAVVATGMVVADLAFAGPPSTAAGVAIVQVVLRIAVSGLLHHHALPMNVSDIGFLIAGYRAGAWLSNRVSLVVVPLLAFGDCSASVIAQAPVPVDWRLLATAAASTSLVPWMVGRYTTARGAYIAELEQRDRLWRQEQHAALDRALSDEREAIARDLHDVISHHVSAIGIHAGAARLALTVGAATGSGAATRSLAAVEASSRAAMVDLRRQLDLLHGRDEAGRRQPGLADIEELAANVRETGLDLEIVTSGAATPLPASLDVTVYRIVQEMLTNALRHGAGRARLEVHEHRDLVVITESNPIAAQPDTGTSLHHGLDGIRRRAELFTGTVDYGITDDGGDRYWRITVSLPIGGI